MAALIEAIITVPEQPSHVLSVYGYAILSGGTGTATGAFVSPQMETGLSASTIRSASLNASADVPEPGILFTALELPDHPASYLASGPTGQNAAPASLGGRLFTVQERAASYSPTLQSSAPTNTPALSVPLVVSAAEQPADPALASFVTSSAQSDLEIPPGQQTISTVLELPDQPVGQIVAGVYVPPTIPVQPGTISTVLENPYHPDPSFGAGIQGPDVRPTIAPLNAGQDFTDTPNASWLLSSQHDATAPRNLIGAIQTVQEFPVGWLVGIFVSWAGVAGPDARVPVADTIVTRQEKSDPGGVYLVRHPITQITVPAITARLVTALEWPDTPTATFLRSSLQTQSTFTTKAALLTRQEQPNAPTGVLRSSVQGPDTRSPTVSTFITAQEQPDAPTASFLRASIQGPDARAPIAQTIITRQELPTQPAGKLHPALTTNTNTDVGIQILLRYQEQPNRPIGALVSSVQGPDARPPITSTITTVQELPTQPPSILRVGVQGPNVASGVQRVLTVQAVPDHPAPFVQSSIVPNIATGVQRILTALELPYHPASYVRTSAAPIPLFATPQGRIITYQERSDHPLSNVIAGSYPSLLSLSIVPLRVLASPGRVRTLAL